MNQFSTTEAEYTALIQAMRKLMLFMALVKEVPFIFDINIPKLEVYCKVFKYNQNCIAVDESKMFTPRNIYRYHVLSLLKLCTKEDYSHLLY